MGNASSRSSSSSSSSTSSSSSSSSSSNANDPLPMPLDEGQRATNEAAAATLALPWSPNKVNVNVANPTEYAVSPGDNLNSIDCSTLTFVIGPESLRIHRADNKALLIQFPYHKILCWGYNEREFQWRVITGDDESSETVTYSVYTPNGKAIERYVMVAVVDLMSKMKHSCVPDKLYDTLQNTLTDLDKAGLGIHCLSAVKQMAVMRKFTAKQGVDLLKTLETISPFDKLECAIVLYPALMIPDSFLLLLDCFEDDIDKQNLLHRLGLQKLRNGTLKQVGKMIGGST